MADEIIVKQRVINYDAASEFTSDDVLFTDNPTTGTKKLTKSVLLNAMQKGTVHASGIGIFVEAQALAHPEYANLDTAPLGDVYCVGLGGIPYCTNFPSGLERGATIFTVPYLNTASGTIQIAVSLTSDMMAIRVYASDAWSAWKYINAVDLPDMQKATVHASGIGIFTEAQALEHPEYANLNTAPLGDVYCVGLVAIPYCTNFPSGLERGATIFTVPYLNTASGTIQIAVSLTSDMMAIRVYASDTWSAWKYINAIDLPVDYSKTNITSGCILDYRTGNPESSQYTTGYRITDYIPVNFGQTVKVGYARGKDLLIAGCLYDSNKTFIGVFGFDKVYNGPAEFNIDDYRAKYVRVNIVLDYLLPLQSNYVNIVDEYYIEPPKKINVYKSRGVEDGGNNFYSIKEASEYVENYGIKGAEITVHAGEYNLVSEIGNATLDNYDGSSRYVGIRFGNNSHWIFCEGATVIFNYTGSNVNVPNLYSPLVISGSCILENLNVEVSNCQYCIHDDWPERESNWIVQYKNCDMVHNGNTFGEYYACVCIGGGLLPCELVVVEGGKYSCPERFPRPISYHSIWGGETSETYPSKIIFKDVWLSGGFRLQDGPYDCNDVDVTITNCSTGLDVGGDHTFFNITEWNNVIRS